MLWQENHYDEFVVPDDVLDIAFRIQCRELPMDHAWLLYQAIKDQLPWIEQDSDFGIHSIHGAASGNGWTRPPDSDGLLQLSRRTRLYLRVKNELIEKTMQLSGQTLDLGDYRLTVEQSQTRPLALSSTLFSRSIIHERDEDEVTFTHRIVETLSHQHIIVTKLLCGLSHTIYTPDRKLLARSVLITDLEPDHSIYLQQNGFGKHRQMGCGIFLPHKSLAAVGKSQE